MPTNHHFNGRIEQQPAQLSACSRRTFLRRLITASTVGIIMPSLLTACGTKAEENPTTEPEADAVADTAVISCQFDPDLTAQDQQTR